MARGLSIHIGLNSVDPNHYQGWDGALTACESDARDMKALADSNAFESRIMLTRDATSRNVLEALAEASRKLQTADILFLSYSGHGGQVPDTNGDEDDGQDETWVLYDRQLIDDELYAAWGRFRAGVRVFVLSDSCHSGTILRLMPDGQIRELNAHETYEALLSSSAVRSTLGADSVAIRAVPRDVQDRVNKAHAQLYKRLQDENPQGDHVGIGASVMLISGCQDNQTSGDGTRNGVFTGTLLHVWKNGQFNGTYRTFYRRILKLMPPYQQPNLYKVGYPSVTFESQRPFTI